jgi:hypothetical protein
MARCQIERRCAVVTELQAAAGMNLVHGIMQVGRDVCIGERGGMRWVGQAAMAYRDPERQRPQHQGHVEQRALMVP